MQPRNPHSQGKRQVTITVTEEELYVLQCGVEEMADKEDGEFAYIVEVAGNLNLPTGVVTYQNMRV